MKFVLQLFHRNNKDDLHPEFDGTTSRRQSEIRETLSQIISDEDTIFPDQFR